METVYAVFTKGIIESRKSFLYGPFCIVYGIAAIILIFSLRKYKNQNKKLFLFGMILGCITEYFSSYIGEVILHIKWWDYSNDFLNINGRTCLFYAVLWGFLSIVLINFVNPILDKYIDFISTKISNKLLKITIASLIFFMAVDATITCYALNNFLIRVANEYDINIHGINRKQSTNKAFSNELMLMTYPNILVVNDNNNEIIHLEDILSDIKNYYYKF